MSDFFIFGTFKCKQSVVDPNFTANRWNAKWRSQLPLINPNPDPVANDGNFYLLNTTHYIVWISDSDYLTRNIDPITDDNLRIEREDGGIKTKAGRIIGDDAETDFNVPSTPAFTPPPPGTPNANPDPFPAFPTYSKQIVDLEYQAFFEERLELGVDYGAVGGMTFDTQITEVADDREQRNITRNLPLGRWQLGNRTVAECESGQIQTFSYLKEFHDARLGSYEGFRFKDWADYKAKKQLIGVGDGVKTEFQLRKAYTIGSVTCYRPIQKPVVGTVGVAVNGVDVAVDPNHTWVVNHETGVISNVNPLPSGDILTCSFEFDIPVWFESDEIGFKLQGYEPNSGDSIYQLESVAVVEQRLPLTIPWEIQPVPEITEALDLGIIFETIEKYSHSTNQLALKSGFTKREAKREEPRLFFDLGSRNYCQSEIDLIQAYFFCARGKAIEFPMVNLGKDYKVRFNQDNLNWRFEAVRLLPEGAEDQDTDENCCEEPAEDAIFNLSSLKVQLREDNIYKLPPYSFTFETLFIDPEDPNDPTIASSNPSGSYDSVGSQRGATQTRQYAVGSYQIGVGFDMQPPGNAPNVFAGFGAALCYWAAGSLWLIVYGRSISSYQNLWYNRGALYQLQADGSFAYYDSPLKDYFSNSLTSTHATRILKTSTGVSLFMRASDQTPFGTVNTSSSINGLLRFEIKNDGSFADYFYKDVDFAQSYSNSSFRIDAARFIVGNKLYFDTNDSINIVDNIGSFDGLEFIFGGLMGQGLYFTVGNPTHAYNDTFIQTEPQMLRHQYDTTTKEMIVYHNNIELERYFFGGNQYSSHAPKFDKVNPYNDGSLIARIYEQRVCPDNTCTSNYDPRLETYYSLWSFEDPYTPKFLEKIKPSGSGADATDLFLASYNSSTARRINGDKYGNFIATQPGGKIIFYKAGSGSAIDISSLFPYTNTVWTNEAVSIYGFALFSHNGNMFGTNSNETLVFVQPGNP